MSFTKEKREGIKFYLCEKISYNEPAFIEKTEKTFSISRQTIYRYLKELQNENIIEKKNKRYILVEESKPFLYQNQNLEEDKIFFRDIYPYIQDEPKNVRDIWTYAFTEMMNNAIEHSESKKIHCMLIKDYLDTTILIIDEGVGIFNKIKEYYKYETLEDAINELFKGKLTTDSQHHSGEGIYFTSRVLDKFVAMSSGKMFSHDNNNDITDNIEDHAPLKMWKDSKGTIIYMELSNRTKKNMEEVFDMYADVDGGFNKTIIPMKNIFEHGYPVSRSQAKRLYNRFDQFKSVELDFRGVENIGQGFAHEMFVVFKREHPNTEVIPINENENVRAMIDHVSNTI